MLQELVNCSLGHSESWDVKLTSNMSELTACIDLVKNHKVCIKNMTVSFDSGLSIEERSKFMRVFSEVFDHIEGLEYFTLNERLEDQALENLLNKKSLFGLKQLSLCHNTVHPAINSMNFWEVSLVKYLQTNNNLKDLSIHDAAGAITAAKYPNLKQAISIHPRLVQFDHGWSPKNDETILKNDPELTLALFRKEFTIAPEKRKQRDESFLLSVQWGIEQILRRPAEIKSQLNELNRLAKQYALIINDFPNLQLLHERIKKLISYMEIVYNTAYFYTCPSGYTHFHKRMNSLLNDYPSLLNDLFSQEKETQALERLLTIKQELKGIFKQVNRSIYPKSYSTIIDTTIGSELSRAKELLEDYTKNNSAISRFFHGHWNRHHVREVNHVIQLINQAQITTVKDLLREIKKIQLVNFKGSLAKRINFIEANLFEDETHPNISLHP